MVQAYVCNSALQLATGKSGDRLDGHHCCRGSILALGQAADGSSAHSSPLCEEHRLHEVRSSSVESTWARRRKSRSKSSSRNTKMS